MQILRLFVALTALLMLPVVYAQDLASTCHASSSYDLTLQPKGLLFDRPTPAPQRVELQDGALHTDSKAVTLRAEDQDRIALFERQLRVLVPRVRTVARHGLSVAVQTLREQAAQLPLSAPGRSLLERRLDAWQTTLLQRITSSNSTHDWQGDVAQAYAQKVGAELVPIVTSDLGQQAVSAAMSGDLQKAADLRDQATGMLTGIEPLMRQRMQALRPEIAALCPAIDKLMVLQQGIRGANGQLLNLIQPDMPAGGP